MGKLLFLSLVLLLTPPKLKGTWVSYLDKNSKLIITDDKFILKNNNYKDVYKFRMETKLDWYSPDESEYIVAFNDEDTLYYEIMGVSDKKLSLLYIRRYGGVTNSFYVKP